MSAIGKADGVTGRRLTLRPFSKRIDSENDAIVSIIVRFQERWLDPMRRHASRI